MAPTRHFCCSNCGHKFTFAEADVFENPFDDTTLLRFCPGCGQVIEEGHTVCQIRLACSHEGCHQTPIGELKDGYWCRSHYPVD